MKELKLKSAAVLTIFRSDEMSKHGKANIARWLRRQAQFLTLPKNKFAIAKRYTARYQYWTV